MAVINVDLGSSDETIDSSNFNTGDTISIVALGNHTLTIDGVSTTVNYGLIGAQAAANVTIDAVNGAVVTINNPTIGVNALSTFTYGVSGDSAMTLASGTVALSLGGNPSLVFSDGGGSFIYNDNTLLGSSITFNVSGFSTGDVVGATEQPLTGFAYSSGTLSLVFSDADFGDADLVRYNIAMSQSDYDYILANGGVTAFINGSGDFVMPVCFTRGTLIDTPEGPVAVETLKAGDKVIGRSGLREVKWVGWRDYSPAWLRTPDQKLRICPVRIRAGALADNVPSSDLVVSPWHHLFVGGKLVRANDLVNGSTIVQELNTRSVSYWHVELDQFDVVRAHGVYSESWADGGNRDFFQNVDVTTLRPEDCQRRKADRPGFEALRDEKRIRPIREKIAARASKLAAQEARAREIKAHEAKAEEAAAREAVAPAEQAAAAA
ncbi:Hint domain-containing protein [Ancylobacter sonchi]|uniref:Hint domain-containing protein n=1 Tax=Ancylobacter sonchi TaxID=1937790 RepID=UPI001BD68A73|nr:Hint domain-containing protein [Ancylobacter sonchi]MBS7536146.1 Hint domain-containing protein [Ancylobacter sonchi]